MAVIAAFIAALKDNLTSSVIGVIVTTTGLAIGSTSLLASLLISLTDIAIPIVWTNILSNQTANLKFNKNKNTIDVTIKRLANDAGDNITEALQIKAVNALIPMKIANIG